MRPHFPGEGNRPGQISYPTVVGSGELQSSNGPLGSQTIDHSPKRVWIRITGNAEGTNRYSWEQVQTADAPTFTDSLASALGGSGGTGENERPAYEVNLLGIDTPAVADGTIVEATPVRNYLVFTYGDFQGTYFPGPRYPVGNAGTEGYWEGTSGGGTYADDDPSPTSPLTPDDDGFPDDNYPGDSLDPIAVRNVACINGKQYVTTGRQQVIRDPSGRGRIDWYDLRTAQRGCCSCAQGTAPSYYCCPEGYAGANDTLEGVALSGPFGPACSTVSFLGDLTHTDTGWEGDLAGSGGYVAHVIVACDPRTGGYLMTAVIENSDGGLTMVEVPLELQTSGELEGGYYGTATVAGRIVLLTGEFGCSGRVEAYTPSPCYCLTVGAEADQQYGVDSLAVAFTSSVTGGTAPSYLWQFGDGATSTLANPSHNYTEPGFYLATLLVPGACAPVVLPVVVGKLCDCPACDEGGYPQALIFGLVGATGVFAGMNGSWTTRHKGGCFYAWHQNGWSVVGDTETLSFTDGSGNSAVYRSSGGTCCEGTATMVLYTSNGAGTPPTFVDDTVSPSGDCTPCCSSEPEEGVCCVDLAGNLVVEFTSGPAGLVGVTHTLEPDPIIPNRWVYNNPDLDHPGLHNQVSMQCSSGTWTLGVTGVCGDMLTPFGATMTGTATCCSPFSFSSSTTSSTGCHNGTLIAATVLAA